MIALALGLVVFASDRTGTSELYVARADGTELRRLTRTVREERLPRVSPDGKTVVFESAGPKGTDVFVMPLAGGAQRALTATGRAGEPSWSPSGSRIVFTARAGGLPAICTMNTDGTDVRRLSPAGAHDRSPAWSPDGKRIAFSSLVDGDEEIFVMNADGSSRRRLTDRAGEDSRPAWSPDGRTLVFNATALSRNDEIVTMTPDGGDRRVLTPRRELQRRYPDRNVASWGARFAPGGRRIVFTSVRTGNAEIWTMGRDGSDVRRVTRDGGQDLDPDWAPGAR